MAKIHHQKNHHFGDLPYNIQTIMVVNENNININGFSCNVSKTH